MKGLQLLTMVHQILNLALLDLDVLYHLFQGELLGRLARLLNRDDGLTRLAGLLLLLLLHLLHLFRPVRLDFLDLFLHIGLHIGEPRGVIGQEGIDPLHEEILDMLLTGQFEKRVDIPRRFVDEHGVEVLQELPLIKGIMLVRNTQDTFKGVELNHGDGIALEVFLFLGQASRLVVPSNIDELTPVRKGPVGGVLGGARDIVVRVGPDTVPKLVHGFVT